MLKGNIELPWYQRSFVWDKKRVENLINSFDQNQFVPPVLIGAVKDKNGNYKNYILDGQQRLTSLILAKCNHYIDQKELINYDSSKKAEQTENEEINDDGDAPSDQSIIVNWQFTELILEKKIRDTDLESYYKKLFKNAKGEDWFNNHFLGFAFIKPDSGSDVKEQSKLFIETFRNINEGGKSLTNLETRKSYYFLEEELKDFFAPEFLNKYKLISTNSENTVIDFIKYLSIVSQLIGNNDELLKYGGRDRDRNEKYYREYILSVIKHDYDKTFKFSPFNISNDQRISKMSELEKILNKLNINKNEFTSIIDVDIYFFGLVKSVIFNNVKSDELDIDKLKNSLTDKIKAFKNEDYHKKSPYSLKYLKERFLASFDAYEGSKK